MQAVIPKLIAKGHRVCGVDNLSRYGERLGHAGGGYKFYKMDLTDHVLAQQVIRDFMPDYIIQAAARIYGVGGFNRYCADILGEDITLHNNVLKAAQYYGVQRVIYISSSMVYENCVQSLDKPVTEEMPDWNKAPSTDYGLSKFTGERLSKAFSKQYGLDYTIWRPFNIITPYERSDGDISNIGNSHVFADFINNIIVDVNNPLPIIGDGSQVRCFTWIHEVAQAIADHSFREETRNEIFNLGNPEPISMIELARIIHEVGIEMNLIPSSELSFSTINSFKDDVNIRIPDVAKAKIVLGWEAKQKVRESIKHCLKEISL